MRFLIVGLVVAVCVLSPSWQDAAAAVTGEQAFAQGIGDFRAANYSAALKSFLQARAAGVDTPNLRYNLGVTYYKLLRYPDARREFSALTRYPTWASLAHYNLGLTAQRLGEAQRAIGHFSQTHRTADDAKLRTLAAVALERLGQAPTPVRASALISISGGYDSNVAQVSGTDTSTATKRGDAFAELFGAARYLINGTAARGVYALGGLQLRNYQDESDYDQRALRIGLGHDADAGRRQTSVSGYRDVIYLDGELFERIDTLDLGARHRLDGGKDALVRYRLGHVDGGDGFTHLDGWWQRVLLDVGFASGSARFRAGYQLDHNDRADLARDGEFFSYSATQHALFASVMHPLADGWRLTARAEFSRSRHHDPDLLDSGTRAITRRDNNHLATLRVDRRLSRPWELYFDYGYYRKQSNLDTYDYTRHQLMLGVEALL